jgi:hypothetical protein
MKKTSTTANPLTLTKTTVRHLRVRFFAQDGPHQLHGYGAKLDAAVGTEARLKIPTARSRVGE